MCVYRRRKTVPKLASFELWAVTDLKVARVSLDVGEYTHTSFYRALHSHALGCVCMLILYMYVGASSKTGA